MEVDAEIFTGTEEPLYCGQKRNDSLGKNTTKYLAT